MRRIISGRPTPGAVRHKFRFLVICMWHAFPKTPKSGGHIFEVRTRHRGHRDHTESVGARPPVIRLAHNFTVVVDSMRQLDNNALPRGSFPETRHRELPKLWLAACESSGLSPLRQVIPRSIASKPMPAETNCR